MEAHIIKKRTIHLRKKSQSLSDDSCVFYNQVQPSSEEGDESANLSIRSNVVRKKRGRKRKSNATPDKKQQQNDNDFTIDQIAAIIGIVK